MKDKVIEFFNLIREEFLYINLEIVDCSFIFNDERAIERFLQFKDYLNNKKSFKVYIHKKYGKEIDILNKGISGN